MSQETASSQNSDESTAATTAPEKTLRLLAFEYAARLETVGADDFAQAVERFNRMFLLPWESPAEELVSRVCSLAFHLQISGGLLTAQPMTVLSKSVIDPEAALHGFFRRPLEKKSPDKKKGKKESESGPRQFLYVEGRLQLLSFTRYRLDSMLPFSGKPSGKPLLPPVTPSVVKEARKNYSWLNKVNANAPTWSAIYRAWLHRLFGFHENRENLLLGDVAEYAARHLYRNEPPFVSYLRRLRIRQAFLPDARLRSYFSGSGGIMPEKITNARISAETDDYQDYGRAEENDADDEGENNQDFTKAAAKIRVWLRNLDNRPHIHRNAAILEAREMLENSDLQTAATADLRLALEWIIYRMRTKREDKDLHRRLSTTTTNLRRLLLFLTAIEGTPFAQINTDDLAEFLENYITVAAAKAQKSTIKLFDHWLREEREDFYSKINWKSGKLFIRETTTFYQLMTEREFVRLLASLDDFPADARRLLRVALLLLRRGGLRCGEAVALSPANLSEFAEELRLKIRASKTRSGRRTLPLDWLLLEDELDEITEFIESRREQNREHLFYDVEEKPLSAAKLGNLVRKAMRLAGIEEQTAHSLRHCFANDLLATYWLQVVKQFDGFDSPANHKFDWARLALENDFASGHIAADTVICFDDIRRLLGHADDKITLMRYVHITDLMTADAVRIAENGGARKSLDISAVARLAGTTTDAARKKFSGAVLNSGGNLESGVALEEVENWLHARLEKITKAKL